MGGGTLLHMRGWCTDCSVRPRHWLVEDGSVDVERVPWKTYAR